MRSSFKALFSIWYLTFYCNPRTQTAVVGKIVMDGLGAALELYGSYIEKYLYTEEMVEVPPPDDFEENSKPCTYYDVSSLFKCFIYQILYLPLILFFSFKELFIIFRIAVKRDVYGKIN